MKLVRLENYKVVVDEELLLLLPFRQLYKNDRTQGKLNFYNFLTILYFTYDPRSDYSYIANDSDRLDEVCASNGLHTPIFNDLELQCIELYKKLTTTTSLELLKSTKTAVGKVRQFLETVDLNAVDDKGKPLYTISSVTTAIKQIPQLAKDLMEAEKAVSREISEQGRARGGNFNKTLMDDGVLI